MPKITVKAKIGDTIHPKYGLLVKGEEYTIEEEELGEEIFERAHPHPSPLPEGEGEKSHPFQGEGQGGDGVNLKKKGGR